MISRQRFIRTAAALGAGLCLPSSLSALPAAKKPSLGLLLSTVGKEMADDPAGTLKRIAGLGYKTLEYSGTFGHPAQELNRLVRQNGLVSIIEGESMWAFMSKLPTYLDNCRQTGKPYLVCYWPWPDSGKNKTIADWRETARRFNEIGEKCKAAGVQLAYHNHDIEFVETEGQIPYDVVLQHTDPRLVTFQMDIWWVAKGGQNPLKYVETYPGRFSLCHVKTADVLGSAANLVGVDYPGVIARLRKAGLRHCVVENENGVTDPFTFLRESADYLKSML